jgi:hypothetical protein
MERTIGIYSKLIKSTRDSGKNASNIVERLAVRDYINLVVDVEQLLDLITTKQYNESSYLNNSTDPERSQLWEPFCKVNLVEVTEVEGVESMLIVDALLKYYQRLPETDLSAITSIQNSEITIASRLWKSSTVYGSSFYRRKTSEISRGNHFVMFYAVHKK